MITSVPINGVETWLSVEGDHGQIALLLHGGLSSSSSMLPTFSPSLLSAYRVAAFDRRGHGRTPDTAEEFHYESMADEAIAVLEHLGEPCHLIGWSDGGIVAILVALRRPELVDRIVLLGANFHHDGLVPFEIDPRGDLTRQMREEYKAESPDGAEHFDSVWAKTLALWAREPELTTQDLGLIDAPALVMAGDDDAVRLSHTCAMYEAIPQSQLSVLPGASHMFPLEQPERTSETIMRFLSMGLPPETIWPMRRA